ncbi:MAG: YidC/Oxa1 family membrane protein insertase [Candidatus Levyibacteriota bacterium]
MGNLFATLFVNPIINVIVLLYHSLVYLHVPFALGFSIIILTVVIRLILYPLTSAQLRMSKKMQTIAPHLSNLKEKHKNDSQKLQQETMRLYKEHGVNPAAGCLPLIVQLPVIWGLYSVLQNVVNPSSKHVLDFVNKALYVPSFQLHAVWDQHFFGLPLGQSPSKLISSVGFLILLFPVATAAFQFIQSKMMFASPQPALVQKKDEKKKDEDFAQAFQSQSLYIFPLMIGFFSYSLPLGLSLYWNTFTIFGIIQQYKIAGLGGLSEWIQKIQKVGNKK